MYLAFFASHSANVYPSQETHDHQADGFRYRQKILIEPEHVRPQRREWKPAWRA